MKNIILINDTKSSFDSITKKFDLSFDLVGTVKEVKNACKTVEVKNMLIDNADNQELSSFLENFPQAQGFVIRVTNYQSFLENDPNIKEKIFCVYSGNQTIYFAKKEEEF